MTQELTKEMPNNLTIESQRHDTRRSAKNKNLPRKTHRGSAYCFRRRHRGVTRLVLVTCGFSSVSPLLIFSKTFIAEGSNAIALGGTKQVQKAKFGLRTTSNMAFVPLSPANPSMGGLPTPSHLRVIQLQQLPHEVETSKQRWLLPRRSCRC